MTSQIPQTMNFLSPAGFKFEIPKAPSFNYFIQAVDFPGIILPQMKASTPFANLNIPAEHMQWEDLSVTFKLDEDLRGYFEIADWITALGRPENFDASKKLYENKSYNIDSVFNQCSLVILNGNMQPNVQVDFYDVLPNKLSGFKMYSTAQDINYITATLTLSYRQYKYSYVNQ
jgi:hypothetical protein